MAAKFVARKYKESKECKGNVTIKNKLIYVDVADHSCKNV